VLAKILQPLLVPNKPPALSCHHLRQVISSLTLRLESQYGVSYMWSISTDRLSRAVVEILSFKDIESRPWPFGYWALIVMAALDS